MNYEKLYKDALEGARECMKDGGISQNTIDYLNNIFPELAESEDERIRKGIIRNLKYLMDKSEGFVKDELNERIAWLEKQGEPSDKGEISDGFHTFNELYYYRMLYNAAFFNMLPKEWVHKSKKHNDGEECFGGGWFIVMANLPTGQISNHYELKDWDLFQIPEKERADKWDGHTPQGAAERLHNFLLENYSEQKPTLPKWKYKKDNTPLLRDSLILSKYGCVTKSPSGAIVSDVWVIDYAELAKLPKEDIEKQGEQVNCPQNLQVPNGGIVLEDFNGGEGYYKVNLDYLNKKQVEEIEKIVNDWNKDTENVKNCIGMILTDASEQRFKDYGLSLKECLAWLEKQGEQIPTWSEEDEGYMDRILEALYDYYPKKYAQSIYDWVKSLKKSMKGEKLSATHE